MSRVYVYEMGSSVELDPSDKQEIAAFVKQVAKRRHERHGHSPQGLFFGGVLKYVRAFGLPMVTAHAIREGAENFENEPRDRVVAQAEVIA